MTTQLRVRTIVSFLGLSLAALAVAACEGTPTDADGSGDRSVRMVGWSTADDGTVKPIDVRIPFEDYQLMHERRLEHMKQAQAGGAVSQQQPLSYLGQGGGGCTGSGCQDIWAVCGDDRTTWLYNRPNGWTLSVLDSSLVIGCVGAGASGSWTGSVSLANTFIPGSTSWQVGLRSMWVSNTYKAELRQTSGPVTSVETYNPWVQVNTGSGNPGYNTIAHRL